MTMTAQDQESMALAAYQHLDRAYAMALNVVQEIANAQAAQPACTNATPGIQNQARTLARMLGECLDNLADRAVGGPWGDCEDDPQDNPIDPESRGTCPDGVSDPYKYVAKYGPGGDCL
jgi:hypothetical protein